MDRRHGRRERPTGAAAADVPRRLVVPHLHRRHRGGRARPVVAHRPFAVRPHPAGAARQRAARAEPGLRHVPAEVRLLRAHGRLHRLRGRTPVPDAEGRLRRQSQLAARGRFAADGGAGRRAPFPRAAVGRHRLHPAGGPAVGPDRKLVADVRADRDPVRPCFARGHAGPGVPPARAHGLDADPARHPAAAGRHRALAGRACDARPVEADPQGQPSRQALRLAGRGQRRQPGGLSLSAAQPHRPERRRQDDLLQHADRAAAAGQRRRRLRRPRHHPPARAPAHPAGPVAIVPDPERLSQPLGIRERPGGGAGAGPPALGPVARRLPATTISTRAPGRCWPRSDWRIAPPTLAPTWATASAACWRSPSRSPPMPACCCSTSRWPAWRKPTGRWWAR